MLKPAARLAAISPAVIIVAIVTVLVAVFIEFMVLFRCPPAICPISCAKTPINASTSFAFNIKPVLINIFCPPATNAFILISFMIYIFTASELNPATLYIGSIHFLIVSSISASWIKFKFCA